MPSTLLPPPPESYETPERPRTTEIERAPHRGGLVLVVEPAAGEQVRVPLPEDGALEIGGEWAGLDEPARVAIGDPTVSARHARIELRRGRARIVDLGSRNGTWVGGARVEAATLGVGACAIVGRTALALEAKAGPTDEGPSLSLPGAIGGSPPMARLARHVHAIAALRAPVLVRGESGSGKEVVARALHTLSRRRGPFHAINVGALPRELAEGELFGAERGAFTGAHVARPGCFEIADGGTLLLDELGELPLDMQAKLLRVLETGEVQRLGARTARRVDVRVVAATWAPLEQRVREGTFREDLFHRIAVLVVDVPPLRDRPGDVQKIAEALLLSWREELGPRTLAPSASSRLAAERWPGNVRELRNVLYRAAALSSGIVEELDVSRALGRTSTPPPPLRRDPDQAVALVASLGSVAAAARATGVPRETLRDWVRLAQGRTRR